MKQFNILYYVTVCILFVGCCDPNFTEIKWNTNDNDVIGNISSKTESINIDIYLDATTSMQGFAVSDNSVYSQFLDQLEASSMSAWKKADAKYYKFGELIKPVTRVEFLSAKNNVEFYHEIGIFKKTFIDNVVKRTDNNRLSVVITDLFQDEGDVNTMVESIKEKCFSKGVMVGILGIKSEFKGKVFDVPMFPQGFDLNTRERPFYALIFGNPFNMEYLFEALKTKPFIKENQFFIFSHHIIKSFDVSLIKSREAKNVNKKAPRKPVKNSFDFGMKEKGTEGAFDLEIHLDKNPRCADFNEQNLEAVSYKKISNIPDAANSKIDSIKTSDIKVINLKRIGNKLTGKIILNNSDPAGNYSYLVYLKANELNGLKTPAWITSFSSNSPIPNTPSASLTYNFEKLSSRLLVANSTIAPTYITKFIINIYKR